MHVLSVSEVNAYLRELLDTDRILGDVWITGEVSNLSRPASGHIYFTLKDDQSQLRCVLFRRANGANVQLEAGDNVVSHGRLSIYEASGALQLYVDFVQQDGVGHLYLEYQRLLAQLESEGLFDESRKRPLPVFPKRIGVVTSPSGAVFHDICNVLRRRWPLVEIVLAPTPVQGPDAAAGIISALQELGLGAPVDLVIVARGGGSIEELAAFNDEMVARTIFSFPMPVISAVGHETDFTIADYVADVRAPTPSAAAELAAPDQREMRMRLFGYSNALTSGVEDAVRRASDDLREMTRWLDRRQPDLDRPRQAIDDRLRRAAIALDRQSERRRGVIERALVRLMALSPVETLGRGYAVVQRVATGEVVSQVGQVQPGERLRIRVQDGAFTAHSGGTSSTGSKMRKAVPREQLALELDPVAQG